MTATHTHTTYNSIHFDDDDDDDICEHLLVILDVFIETAKLTSLKYTECHKENNAENEWIDTTQYQVLHLKVTTCNDAANIPSVLM